MIRTVLRIGISAAPAASLQSKMSLDAEFVILHLISNELTVQTKSIKFHFNKNRILLWPLTKNRLANRGPRAVLAVLGCRGLDQHISWSLHLQILSQLKWFSSSTGSDRRKQGRRRGEGTAFVFSLKPVPHRKAGLLHHSMPAVTFYRNRKSS